MLRVVVIILVFLGAIFVFLSSQPERVFSRSADGVVTLEGVSRNVRSVNIDANPQMGVPLEPRVSAYYLIIPDLGGVDFSPTLTVQILEQWKQVVSDPTELVFFVFEGPTEGWRLLPTDVDLSTSTLHAQVDLTEPVWIAIGSML
jgi:uncharacterized protein YggT (Ycf19 family)